MMVTNFVVTFMNTIVLLMFINANFSESEYWIMREYFLAFPHPAIFRCLFGPLTCSKQLVDPKRAALKEAAKVQAVQEARLAETRERLRGLQATITELEGSYEASLQGR